MNPKQLSVLAAITVVAIVVAFLVGGGDKREEPEGKLVTGDKVFTDLPVNEVTRIEVSEGDRKTTLERSGGRWGVAEREGYPADFERIKRVITGLRDLEVSESIAAGESQLGRFQLKPPAKDDTESGRLVQLTGEGDKDLGGLVIGKNFAGAVTDNTGGRKQGAGNYVRNLAKDGQVFIVAGSFYDIQGGPANWLERRPIAIQNPKTVEITQPDGAVFRFTREEKGGVATMEGLSEKEEMNTVNTGTLSSPFSTLSFVDVMVGDEAGPERTGLDQAVSVSVSTFDGFKYDLKLSEVVRDAEPAPDAEEGAEPEKVTKYFITYQVDATLADTRVPEDDEKVAEDASEEEKTKALGLKTSRDETFARKRKSLEEKLAKEQAVAGKVFEIDSFSAQKFFLKRQGLVKEKQGDAPGSSPSLLPPIPEATIPGLPGTTIPGVVPTGPAKPAEPKVETPAAGDAGEESAGGDATEGAETEGAGAETGDDAAPSE